MSGYIANTGYQFPIQNYDGTTGTPVTSAATTANTNGPGYLWAAGLNTYGKLGNQSTVSYSSPIQIGSLTTWKQISSGGDHMAAVTSDGTLWTSGLNNNGQLGNGNIVQYSSPIQVGSLTNWSQVATGYATSYFTAAIKTDGTLWSWGSNSTAGTATGQLGNGNTLNYSSPIQIGSLTSWSKVSLGSGFASAIKTDGTLWTWGGNTYGQLGNGTTTNYSSPIQIGSLTNWSQISAGNGYTAAIKTDGTLWTWGNGTNGVLGNGTTTRYSSPIQIGALTNWSKISSGDQTVAVKTDGTLWTWGGNTYGQLGNGTTTNYSSPIQIGSLTTWSQVSTSERSSVAAIKTDGTLWTWGRDGYGQLGNGTITSYSSPIQVGSLTNWNSVSMGSSLFAIQNSVTNTVYNTVDMADMFVGKDSWYNSGLWGWGYNNAGQIGNGSVTSYSSPVQVGLLTNWKQVASGSSLFKHAIKTDGSLWASGSGEYGHLGLGNTINYSSPVQVGLLTNWKQISSKGNTLGAVKTDGTLWMCGYGGFGNLGNGGSGFNYYVNSPIQVGTATNWKFVESSNQNTAAIKTDGTFWIWGRNDYGQLGNGTTTNYSSPIQIGSLYNWKTVSCGYSTAAIKTDGSLWAWGRNDYGQLGNGTTTNYSSPIQIGSLTNWKQVSVGYNFTAAIKTDNTLWICGYNNYGQLGNGTTTNYSSPIQIGSLNNWKQVSTGYAGAGAIKTDGTMWTWGQNNYGQLGNGTIVNYSSPIQIGSLTIWKQLDFSQSPSAIQAPDYQLPQYVPGPPTGLSI